MTRERPAIEVEGSLSGRIAAASNWPSAGRAPDGSPVYWGVQRQTPGRVLAPALVHRERGAPDAH
jgi:hypothetical protein